MTKISTRGSHITALPPEPVAWARTADIDCKVINSCVLLVPAGPFL